MTLRYRRLLSLTALVALLGCGSSTEPTFDTDADVRILFIGNSLTFFNDLPGLVASIADVSGIEVSVISRANANFSLEDHWHAGAAAGIRDLEPDIVVMQQGPSSLEQNKLHLRSWSDSLARVAHEVGATTALYMVWPSVDRILFFDDVLESYRLAAEASGSLFAPAGEAWREYWEEDPHAELYGGDGFHPSQLGSVVAAVTIASVVLDLDPTSLPATVAPDDGDLPTITLGEELAGRVGRAVARAIAAYPSSTGAAAGAGRR